MTKTVGLIYYPLGRLMAACGASKSGVWFVIEYKESVDLDEFELLCNYKS